MWSHLCQHFPVAWRQDISLFVADSILAVCYPVYVDVVFRVEKSVGQHWPRRSSWWGHHWAPDNNGLAPFYRAAQSYPLCCRDRYFRGSVYPPLQKPALRASFESVSPCILAKYVDGSPSAQKGQEREAGQRNNEPAAGKDLPFWHGKPDGIGKKAARGNLEKNEGIKANALMRTL